MQEYVESWCGVSITAEQIKTWIESEGSSFTEGGSNTWRINNDDNDVVDLTAWASFVLRFVPASSPVGNDSLSLLSGLLELDFPAARSLLDHLAIDKERLADELLQRGVMMRPFAEGRDDPFRQEAKRQFADWCIDEDIPVESCLDSMRDPSSKIELMVQWLESQYLPLARVIHGSDRVSS